MFYKNLRIYRFTSQLNEYSGAVAGEINKKLSALPFKPCQPHDEFSFGFVNPVDELIDLPAFKAGQYIAFCGKKEERILPSAAINDELAKQINAIEARESRRIGAKERSKLKDQIIFDLLPRALTKSTKTHAYIDATNGLLIVDSASPKKAEDLLTQVRKCLGSLPVTPLSVNNNPQTVMTSWLEFAESDNHQSLKIDDECELRSPEDGGAIVRCKRHDLTLPEIKSHLDRGMLAHKLAMTWDDRISFTIDADLAIKRMRFLDVVQEQAAELQEAEEQDVFTADFIIMTGEIDKLINGIAEAFGGMPELESAS